MQRYNGRQLLNFQTKQFDRHEAIDNRAAEPWFELKKCLKMKAQLWKILRNEFSSEFNET